MGSRKIAWWQLYLLAFMMFPLFVLEHFFPVSGVSGEIVDIGIVIFSFGAVMAWVHLNSTLLQVYYDQLDRAGNVIRMTVYERELNYEEDGYDSQHWIAPSNVMEIPAGARNAGEDEGEWWVN